MPNLFARWIMDRATANPPRGREDWARAMRAEFDILKTGELSWALGCWTTMAGWRLQADALFLAAIVAIALVTPWWIMPQALWLLTSAAPDEAIRVLFIPTAFAIQVLPAVLLAAWRPDRWRLAGLAAPFVEAAYTVVLLHSMGGGWFSPGSQYFNAPLPVSIAALLAACWAGAWAAAGLSRAVRRQSRRFFSAT